MNEQIRKYWDQLIAYWRKLERRQRLVLLITVGVLALTVVLFVTVFSRTQYSYAFTDLDPTDAASVTGYLSTQKIPYKLSADGKSIGVPTTSASQVKIDVESQGLVKNGSIGYGIFRNNMSSLGMTDHEFSILKVDALAGEVQQLINAMNGVSSSKVIINLPEQSVFLSDNTQASSAVVVIKFKPGYRPDQVQIDTMYNLVMHSVPNLPMDDITISDQNGELLPSSNVGGSVGVAAAGVADQQFQIKQQFENNIQKNVYHLLSTILGPNKVVVSVVASLNFDKKNSHEQLVKPVTDTKGIEISTEHIQKSYSSDGGSQAGGVPGTGPTDVPGYPSGSTGGTSQSDEIQDRVNYDVNRITNDIVSSPYSVEDLTINVAVEPPVKDNPASLSNQTITEIQRMLMNIVGTSLAGTGQTISDTDLARKVLVISHTFDGAPQLPSSSPWKNPLLYALGAALLLAAVGGGYLVARRRRPAVEEEEFGASEPVPVQELDLDSVNENQVRKQLESLARKKPEEFVGLLRSWLADD